MILWEQSQLLVCSVNGDLVNNHLGPAIKGYDALSISQQQMSDR